MLGMFDGLNNCIYQVGRVTSEDRARLHRRGLTDEEIKREQLTTVDEFVMPTFLGIDGGRKKGKIIHGGVEFPHIKLPNGEFVAHGRVRFYELCELPPENEGEKPRLLKYGSTAGLTPPPYDPLATQQKIADNTLRILLIVEAEFSAILASRFEGVGAVAIGGAPGWSAPREDKRYKVRHLKELLREFLLSLPPGTIIIICFDSDAENNPNVRNEEHLLQQAIKAIGLTAHVLPLPAHPVTHEKQGPDDIIARDPELFAQLLATAVVPQRQVAGSTLPNVLLDPDADSKFEEQKAGRFLDATGKVFVQAGQVVQLTDRQELEPIKVPALQSHLTNVVEFVRNREKTVMYRGEAERFANSIHFLSELSPIELVSRCPILLVRDGHLEVVTGYDRDHRVLAFGTAPEEMTLEEASKIIRHMFSGYNPRTPGDLSRMFAALITPALLPGQLIPDCGVAPLFFYIADAERAGKSLAVRANSLSYLCELGPVTQSSGGVGGIEEELSRQLLSGRTHINIDNWRGLLNSPKIESMITEGKIIARTPYSAGVEISTHHVSKSATGNQAELTRDLAQRTCFISIVRHSPATTPQWSLEKWVRDNQPRILGAIFCVVREWHRRGCPRTDERRHNFMPWSQSLDYMVQELLGAAPLMDDHQQIQDSASDPQSAFVDQIIQRISTASMWGHLFSAGDLLDMGVTHPKLQGKDLTTEKGRTEASIFIGQQLGMTFRGVEDNTLHAGDFILERVVSMDEKGRERRAYRVLPFDEKERERVLECVGF